MFDTLPEGPLDIVGDIHGELQALVALLAHLGYGPDGSHPAGRRLVFVGDLCDRGPNSPGVVRLVQRIVEGGRGSAILGNHELNLLCRERKEGNDWFWNEDSERDRRYEPTVKPTSAERHELLAFFATLPLMLQRADLRVVHAAWNAQAIKALEALGARTADGIRRADNALEAYHRFAADYTAVLANSGLQSEAERERVHWQNALSDPSRTVPMLHALAAVDEMRQMGNPVKVLTSGVERKSAAPFYSSGKWRFVQRVPWWDEYDDAVPVVVGHYWRRLRPVDRMLVGKGDADLFADLAPTAWHGKRANVFCVDFSVGGRYRERLDGLPGTTTHLAALRWPERELVLDSGERSATVTPAGC